MPAGIDHHPDTRSLDELRASAWRVFAPQIEERIASLIEEYGTARSHDLGDDNLPIVATAIASGRQLDDVLDDVAESATKMGGTVVIIPCALMPSTTGIAAIDRYSISP